MNGKGDKRRPRQITREEYEERYERIFGKCPNCGGNKYIETHDGIKAVWELCECQTKEGK